MKKKIKPENRDFLRKNTRCEGNSMGNTNGCGILLSCDYWII